MHPSALYLSVLKKLCVTLIFLVLSFIASAQLRADFSMDKSGGCSPVQINFINRTTGASSAAVYKWDLGNTNTSALKDPSAIYITEQSYTVTLTVTDGANTSVKTQVVTVYKKPVANFKPSAPKVCLPSPATFISTSEQGDGAITNYTWDFGDASSQQGYSAQVSKFYPTTRTATVTLTVSDQYGCYSSVTKNNVVEVLPRMEPAFTVNGYLFCDPADEVVFTNNSKGPGTLKYDWTFEPGSTSTEESPKHIFNKKGLYNVSMKLSNEHGCQATANSGTINVAYFNTAITSNIQCRVANFYSNSYVTPGSSNWDFGDGKTATGPSVQHTYTTTGKYTVTLTNKYNNNTCEETVTKEVEITVPSFNTAISETMHCRQVNFRSSGSPYESVWDFGDGATITGTTPVHTYTTPGKYTVTLTNRYLNNTCVEKVTKEIEVKDLVDYKSTFTIPAEACLNEQVTFSSSSNSTPTSQYWEFGNGNVAYYSTPSTYYYTTGIYTVKLTNTFGTCKEEVTKKIVVNPLPGPPDFTITQSTFCEPPVTYALEDKTPGAVKWAWAIGDIFPLPGTTSDKQSLSHIFKTEGYYSVGLTVTNKHGCKSTGYQSVNVRKPSVQIVQSRTYPDGIFNCGTVVASFGVSTSETITSYNWTLGNGQTSTLARPQETYTTPGFYNVSLTYKTDKGCTGTLSAGTLPVYKKPTASFSYSIPQCGENNSPVDFVATADASTAVVWETGDGGGGNSSSFKYRYSNPGTYNVKLTTYNGGCKVETEKQVVATIKPSYLYINSVIQGTCDKRNVFTFRQGNLNLSSQIEWNFGDGTIVNTAANISSVEHTYTKSGNYTVRATAKNGNCTLTDTYSLTVMIAQKPTLVSSRTSLCKNEELTLSISNLENNLYYANQERGQYSIVRLELENGTAIPFYDDFFSNWNYSKFSAKLYNLPQGELRLKAIVRISGNGSTCTDETNYVSIKVNGPSADFQLTTDNVCFKSPLKFKDASTTITTIPIKSWAWSFGDGESTTTTTAGAEVEHTYKNPGSPSVKLTVTDNDGCSSSATKTAKVRGPKVSFSASGLYWPNVPLNTTVNFTNTSNNAHLTQPKYTWDYGDQTQGTGFNGSQTYTKAGSYTVKLTGADPLTGCSDEASYAFTVKEYNTAFTINTTYLGNGKCLPVLVQLNNISTNYTSLTWDLGDGTVINGQQSPSHTYRNAGRYVIKLYTKGYNNDDGKFEEIITIAPAPTATLSSDILEGCLAQTVTLNSEALNTENYIWDFGDGTVRPWTNTVTNHKYLTPGVYTPSVLLMDPRGCIYPVSMGKQIIIDSLAIGINGVPEYICEEGSLNVLPKVLFSVAHDQLNKPLTWDWDFGVEGNTDVADTKAASFTYLKAGTYTVTLKSTSQYGCAAEARVPVLVRSKTALKIKAPELLDVCANSTAVINVTGADSYEWVDFTDWLNNTKTGTPIVKPLGDAEYTVIGYDKYKCSSDMAKVRIKLQPLPTVSAGPDVEVIGNTEHLLQTTASSDVILWRWSPSDYLSCTDCPAPVVKPKKSDNYIVTVKTKYNCVTSDTIHVKLLCLNGYVYIPNSFTPNNDGSNDIFYIKGKGIGKIKTLKIFSRWGDEVFGKNNFDIDDVSQGWNGRNKGVLVPAGNYIYVAELQCESSGEIIVKKGSITVLY